MAIRGMGSSSVLQPKQFGPSPALSLARPSRPQSAQGTSPAMKWHDPGMPEGGGREMLPYEVRKMGRFL